MQLQTEILNQKAQTLKYPTNRLKHHELKQNQPETFGPEITY